MPTLSGRRTYPVIASAAAAALVSSALALPSGSAEPTAPATSYVVPISWDEFDQGLPVSDAAELSRAILLNTNRYALTSWYEERGFAGQAGDYLDLGGTSEHFVRPVGDMAQALATSLSTGAYDAEAVTVPERDARERTIRLATSVAYNHRASSPGGWGDAWQSALWASSAGFAGWMLWDELAEADRTLIERMVVYEANRFIDYEVPYYRDADGEVVFPGDTKAEENAWNAFLLTLAAAMMPDHPNWAVWQDKAIELMISAYSRPADVSNWNRIVNGKPLAEWLNGSNVDTEIRGPVLVPVTADSHFDEAVNPVATLVDGDLSTWWASDGSPMPHWVEIDLDAPTEVGEVIIRGRRLGDARIHDLDVEISAANGDVEHHVRDNQDMDIPVRLDSPVAAERIRVTIHRQTFQGQPRTFADLAEIELYDPSGHQVELAERIDLGDQYAVVINHNRIHPDYQTSITNSTSSPLAYSLAGQSTPRAALFNADIIYRTMVDLEFGAPPFEPPGGTIYTRDSEGEPVSEAYYPEGTDWGRSRQTHFMLVDTQADRFGFDDGVSIPATEWARVHATRALDMQERHDDGRTYGPDDDDVFQSREEWVARNAARDYQSHWLVHQDAVEMTNRAYPVRPGDYPGATINLDTEPRYQPGQPTPVTVHLLSESAAPLIRASVELGVPAGWDVTLADGADEHTRVPPGHTATTTWLVTPSADADVGPAPISATATYVHYGRQRVLETSAQVLVPRSGNVALGQPTEVSSVRSPDNGGDKAVDGSFADEDRWMTSPADHEPWIVIDLEEPFDLDSVYIYSGHQAQNHPTWSTLKDFTVEVHTEDGWVEVAEIVDNEDHEVAVTELGISGDQVRLDISRPSASSTDIARVFEIEVYEDRS